MSNGQKIVPNLWFDTQADVEAAAAFYTALFPESRVLNTAVLHDTPNGSTEIIDIELYGQRFTLFNGGSFFKFNPSVSFMVSCATRADIDRLWTAMLEGGSLLMPLESYSFSEYYGWVVDKFGVSWQLILSGDEPITHRITPSLMFVGEQYGQAEAAIQFYTSIFNNAQMGEVYRYNAEQPPDTEGMVMYADATLEGQSLSVADSALLPDAVFSEAISLAVLCDSQSEIDYFWQQLSAVPEAEQCGWVKDKFGVSWQIVPSAMDTMMQEGNDQQIAQMTQAMLQMKKFDLAALERAYDGV